MKLVLDERLLEKAMAELGVKTYSAAVNLALEEVLRMRKMQGLPDLMTGVAWEGSLAELREDDAPDRRGSSSTH